MREREREEREFVGRGRIEKSVSERYREEIGLERSYGERGKKDSKTMLPIYR